MSYPTKDLQHVSDALALLTDHYKSKPVISGLLTAWTNRVQELEGVLWDVIEKFFLTLPPTGDQLTTLGILVGEPRDTENDASYLVNVLLRIRVNRSSGRAEDVIQVANLALGTVGLSNYTESCPAAFTIEARGLLLDPRKVAKFLNQTRAAATSGLFRFSTWPRGNDIKLVSRYGGVTGEGTWSSVHSTVKRGGSILSARQI